jgi:hypothetical protein
MDGLYSKWYKAVELGKRGCAIIPFRFLGMKEISGSLEFLHFASKGIKSHIEKYVFSFLSPYCLP